MSNNTEQLKKLLKEQFYILLTEDINYNFNFKGKKLKVRFDVNANPTKKGIKIQFTPNENLASNPQEARQFMTDLQIHLNQKLGVMGMNVDFDPDVPYQNVIGFTLKLGAISNMISKALGGTVDNSEEVGPNPNPNPNPDEKQNSKINQNQSR